MKIKNILKSIMLIGALVATTGCEDYLDKAPNVGLTKDDVYKDYSSFRGYLDECYRHLDNFHGYQLCTNARTSIGAISDELASLYNFAESIAVNGGNWLSSNITNFEIGIATKEGSHTSIKRAYTIIRIATTVIETNSQVLQITEDQRNELLGQAYFLRSWAYFQLIKRYGGMPKFDKIIYGDGDDNLARMSYHDSHDWMISDINEAIKLLPELWDDANVGRPNKIAAEAFKSMAQLYDASPLMQNPLESISVITEYDQDRALIAAKSTSDVIAKIEGNSALGSLMPKEDYKNIFYWSAPNYRQPEFIWYNRAATPNMNRYIRAFWLPSELAKGTGNDAVAYNAPTQNMVDMFERQGDDGVYYPISDPKSGYTADVALTDPFSKRDPRLSNNILVPGETWGVDNNNKPIEISTYKNGTMYNTVKNNNQTNIRQQTGYICKKFIWETANQYKNEWAVNRVITVYIRMATLYLNYAEAAFEATGSATTVPKGCVYTAEQAINIVRQRAGLTDLPAEYVSDPVKFREAYRRERCVELMFEDSRWWDLRRWMIAHEVFAGVNPIKGINATKAANGSFTFETIDITPEVRKFDLRNYWYPFSMDDVASLDKLQQNPGW